MKARYIASLYSSVSYCVQTILKVCYCSRVFQGTQSESFGTRSCSGAVDRAEGTNLGAAYYSSYTAKQRVLSPCNIKILKEKQETRKNAVQTFTLQQ